MYIADSIPRHFFNILFPNHFHVFNELDGSDDEMSKMYIANKRLHKQFGVLVGSM